MLIVEHIKLVHMRTLVNTAGAKLELYEHETGSLVLASMLKAPPGEIFYVTTDFLLNQFMYDKITLQELFDKAPSIFVEIVKDCEVRLYFRHDIEIILLNGEKKYSGLIATK